MDSELGLAVLHRLNAPDNINLVLDSVEEITHAFHVKIQGAGELRFAAKVRAGRKQYICGPGLKHCVFAAVGIRQQIEKSSTVV